MSRAAAILRNDGSELSPWVRLWLPLGLVAAVYGAFFSLARPAYEYWFERELGVVELATPLILVFAIVYGLRAFRRRKGLPAAWLGYWLLLVTAGCVYFAGEDLSWGQHLAGWETPERLKNINDQQETNIHNISSWFDQKPRLLLELWVVIGGILVAGWRRWRGEIFARDGWAYWFWPGFACFPAALLGFLVKLPERIKTVFDIASLPTDLRYSELQELMFAVFLLCYLASNYRRLLAVAITQPGAGDFVKKA